MSVKGLDYPLRIDATTGHFMRSSDAAKKVANVHRILQTRRTESPVTPAMGTRTVSMVFSDIDPTLFSLIDMETRRAIATHEPRVIIQSIDIKTDEERGTVYVDVTLLDIETGETIGTTSKPG